MENTFITEKFAEITRYQISKAKEYKEKWIDTIICTKPVAREKADQYIALSYINAGLKPPKEIIWCNSPHSMHVAIGLICNKDFFDEIKQKNTNIVPPYNLDVIERIQPHEVSNLLLDLIQNKPVELVYNTINNCVKDSILDFAHHNLNETISWIAHSIFDRIRYDVQEFCEELNIDFLECSNLEDIHRLAFIEYFRNEFGLISETQKIISLIELSKYIGAFLPYENVCFVSEKPTFLNLGNEKRLRTKQNLLISYSNGYNITSNLYKLIESHEMFEH